MSDWGLRYAVSPLTVVEICAGAGGQALGLEQAGFEMVAAVELDQHACETLKLNRPSWNVLNTDVRRFSGRPYEGVDLLAGGVPCPPFSIAGQQLGGDDERDLFPEALRLVAEIRPRAVMIENVRGLMSERFTPYRALVRERLHELGYHSEWRVLNASDFGVPQLRPRSVLVALRNAERGQFAWPAPVIAPPTVGETLRPLMAERGWPGASSWARAACTIAPTIVGGSKKHGGPDLGPTRARAKWAELRVDGRGVADSAPDRQFPKEGIPRLTIPMVARIQGFPNDWLLAGGKTARYRQIGNAFPPPVAEAVGYRIVRALEQAEVEPIHSAQLRLMEQERVWVA